MTACSLFCCADVSCPVCTCQKDALPIGLTCWALASAPPPLAWKVCSIWVTVACGATNWNSEPPLKSMLKFSPKISSASTLMPRMAPEIVYQSFCRPTKSKETSPRYSRPAKLLRRAI